MVLISKNYYQQAQVGLLLILLVAMTDFVVGTIMGPQNIEQKARGFVGLSGNSYLSLRFVW